MVIFFAALFSKHIRDPNGNDKCPNFNPLKWAKYVFRTAAWAATTVLFIPIIRGLVSLWDCDYTQGTLKFYLDPTVICFKDPRQTAGAIAAVIILMGFLPFALRLSRSEGKVQAIPEGRIFTISWKHDNIRMAKHTFNFMHKRARNRKFDMYFLIARFVITVITIFLAHSFAGKIVLVVTSGAIALVLFFLAFKHPPYVNNHVNGALSGLITGLLFTNIMALLLLLLVPNVPNPGQTPESDLLTIIYLAGAPTSVIAGWAIQEALGRTRNAKRQAQADRAAIVASWDQTAAAMTEASGLDSLRSSVRPASV